MGLKIEYMVTEDLKTLQIISDVICEANNVKLSDLKGKDRHRQLVESRYWIFYFGNKYTKLPLNNIGAIFGARHDLVIYGIKSINNLIEHNGYNSLHQKLSDIIKMRIPNNTSVELEDFSRHIGNFMISDKN